MYENRSEGLNEYFSWPQRANPYQCSSQLEFSWYLFLFSDGSRAPGTPWRLLTNRPQQLQQQTKKNQGDEQHTNFVVSSLFFFPIFASCLLIFLPVCVWAQKPTSLVVAFPLIIDRLPLCRQTQERRIPSCTTVVYTIGAHAKQVRGRQVKY